MLTNPFLHFLDKFYQFFIRIGSNLQSLLLLYLRVIWGHQFFTHGINRLGFHFTPFELGIEAVLGFCLFIGFASRIVTIPLIILTLRALISSQSPELSHFQFLTEPINLVRQVPYPFLLTSLIVFIFGPGRISIDAWIKRWVDNQPRY